MPFSRISFHNPRVDPSHIAAAGVPARNMVSVVCTPNGFIDISKAAPCTIVNSAPPVAMYSGVGMAGNVYAASTPPSVTAAIPTAAQTSMTFGGIFINNASSGSQVSPLISDGTGTGQSCIVVYGNQMSIKIEYGVYTLGPNVTANTPYFVAVSHTAAIYNWVVVNLATGGVSSGTASNPAGYMQAPTATICIGATFYAVTVNTYVAAGMYAKNKLLSQGELLKWAEDPVGFWYPDRKEDQDMLGVIIAAAASAPHQLTTTGAG